MPNDGNKRRRQDERGAKEPAQKKRPSETNQSIIDVEERKMEDHLNMGNESMSQLLSAQALLHRSIGSAAFPQSDPQNFLLSRINSNAALQMLTQERARAAIPNNLWSAAPDLTYRNVSNASSTSLASSIGSSALPSEISHSSGVSQLVSDLLLSDYQRRLGSSMTTTPSISAAFLQQNRATGLSPLLLDQVFSRATAVNYQHNLDQALAIIRDNESARRARHLQLSRNSLATRPDLYSAMLWDSANGHQAAVAGTDISNRNLMQTGSQISNQTIELSGLNSSTGARDLARVAASGTGTSQSFARHSHPISERMSDTSAADSQGHDSTGVLLATEDDEKNLSEYQALVRKQLEFFEATEDDVSLTTQGRKKIVYIGQVGIRCIHCAHRPANLRSRGSVYFPSKLSSVYQAAQNMAVSHLMDACDEIDENTRNRLSSLRLRKDTAAGGKAYWASSCARVGVSETETGLRLTENLR